MKDEKCKIRQMDRKNRSFVKRAVEETSKIGPAKKLAAASFKRMVALYFPLLLYLICIGVSTRNLWCESAGQTTLLLRMATLAVFALCCVGIPAKFRLLCAGCVGGVFVAGEIVSSMLPLATTRFLWPILCSYLLLVHSWHSRQRMGNASFQMLALAGLLTYLIDCFRRVPSAVTGAADWGDQLVSMLASSAFRYTLDLQGPYAFSWLLHFSWLLALFLAIRGHWRGPLVLLVGSLLGAAVICGVLHSSFFVSMSIGSLEKAGWIAVASAAALSAVVLGWRDPVSQQFGNTSRRQRIFVRVGLTGSIVLVGGAVCIRVDREVRPFKVAVSEDGYLDWKVAEHGKYGVYESGMFGELPRRMRMLNAELTKFDGVPSPDVLAADALLYINPQRSFEASELQQIEEFVAGGGALIVLGDHTDIVGTQQPLNKLLGFTGIRFPFDSAYPVSHGWVGCQRSHIGTLSYLPEMDCQSSVGVGASLEVSYPAMTILSGRHGISDIGNRLNKQGAFLGNYWYDRGEKAGDIPLVAVQRHKQGMVVVFGDTSPFQNGALSVAYRFIFETMAMARGEVEVFSVRFPLLAYIVHSAWMLAFIGMCTVWIREGGGRPVWHLDLAVPLAFGLIVVILQQGERSPMPGGADEFKDDVRLAVISVASYEQIAYIGPHDLGYGSMQANLSREGLVPVVTADDPFDWNPDLLYLSGSMALADAEYQQRLLKYITEGGGVLMAAGPESRDEANLFLKSLGLKVLSVPMGPVPVIPQDVGGPRFKNAYGIGLADTRNPEIDYEVLWSYQGIPIVVGCSIGKGRLVVIGDGEFTGDANLESFQGVHEGNIKLVTELIRFCIQK